VEDIFLVGRLDHSDLADIVDEEAAICGSAPTVEVVSCNLPERLEVGWKRRIWLYGVFLTPKHDPRSCSGTLVG
jgi:hypothetical protein